MPSKTIRSVLESLVADQYWEIVDFEDAKAIKGTVNTALRDIEALCLEVIGGDVDTETLEVGQVNLKDWINTTNSLRQQQRERLTKLLGENHE